MWGFFCLESDILICGFLLNQTQLAEHEHEIIEMNSNSEKLQQSYNELLEFKIVLQKVFSMAICAEHILLLLPKY